MDCRTQIAHDDGANILGEELVVGELVGACGAHGVPRVTWRETGLARILRPHAPSLKRPTLVSNWYFTLSFTSEGRAMLSGRRHTSTGGGKQTRQVGEEAAI